jgi:hypothetical protein
MLKEWRAPQLIAITHTSTLCYAVLPQEVQRAGHNLFTTLPFWSPQCE